jgi:hypothetical protein
MQQKIGAEVRAMGVSYYIRKLVSEETGRRVASAAKSGETLLIPASAAAIARDFPGSTLSEEEIRNQLFAKAARADVEVELGR